MITLPEGFDVALLISDFAALALPFVGIATLIATGTLIMRIMRRAV